VIPKVFELVVGKEISGAGFLASGRINRKDFGVSWHGVLDRGGVVVGDEVEITIDAEAIRD